MEVRSARRRGKRLVERVPDDEPDGATERHAADSHDGKDGGIHVAPEAFDHQAIAGGVEAGGHDGDDDRQGLAEHQLTIWLGRTRNVWPFSFSIRFSMPLRSTGWTASRSAESRVRKESVRK